MGKRDKRKAKKGKGAEKTAMKTEKNQSQKLKKQLAKLGEEDVEKIIARIQAEDALRKQVTEEPLPDGPSRRVNFSLTAHPDKEELILFGGEFFNGQKTDLYNDLLIYNTAKKEWRKILAPKGPPPRCSHQAVALSTGSGAQLWIVGGEFSSPSQAQFHHYKDLWVFHLQDKKWEKISAPGGPSPRSGHRMVVSRKHLVVFGGFHDNVFDYRYLNDVHAFDIEARKWKQIQPTGTPPPPRSGCQMAALTDGRILVYGGYSKERIKKDVDHGNTFSDMFYLVPEKNDQSFLKWKWVTVKQSGVRPLPRSGFSMATAPSSNRAYVFGGVWDEEEDEETIRGSFLNDLNILELDRGAWRTVTLSGKKKPEKKQRRKAKNETDEDEEEPASKLEGMTIDEPEENLPKASSSTFDDGIFKVTIGSSTSSTSSSLPNTGGTVNKTETFMPSPRMNAGMVIRKGVLYLYGGVMEQEDKQLTLADFYSLDLHKLDEWQTLIANDSATQEWIESDSSSDDDDDEMDQGAKGKDDEESSEEEESDSDSDEEEKEMEVV